MGANASKGLRVRVMQGGKVDPLWEVDASELEDEVFRRDAKTKPRLRRSSSMELGEEGVRKIEVLLQKPTIVSLIRRAAASRRSNDSSSQNGAKGEEWVKVKFTGSSSWNLTSPSGSGKIEDDDTDVSMQYLQQQLQRAQDKGRLGLDKKMPLGWKPALPCIAEDKNERSLFSQAAQKVMRRSVSDASAYKMMEPAGSLFFDRVSLATLKKATPVC